MNSIEIMKSDYDEIIIDYLSKLYDPKGYRATGRSTTLAKAYIRIAKRYPDEWIMPNDHHFSKDDDRYIMKKIHDEINNLELEKYEEFEFSRDKFRYTFKIDVKNENYILRHRRSSE